jgi:hypothetical protein
MKQKRYWLIVGSVLSIFATVISLIGQITWKHLSVVSIPGFVILTITDELIFGGTIKYPTFTGATSFILSLSISFIVYFIIGAIIGILYGLIHRSAMMK